MRFIQGIIIFLLATLTIWVVVGLLLPDEAHVERSIVINAPPAKVFTLLDDFESFNKWSPWYKKDPNASYQYSGPESGAGARMTWESENPQVGSGSQEIIESVPNERVKYRLDFGKQGEADAEFMLEPEDGGTQVTWSLHNEMGYNLLGRYFALLYDGLIGPEYEAGLRRLKELAENQQE